MSLESIRDRFTGLMVRLEWTRVVLSAWEKLSVESISVELNADELRMVLALIDETRTELLVMVELETAESLINDRVILLKLTVELKIIEELTSHWAMLAFLSVERSSIVIFMTTPVILDVLRVELSSIDVVANILNIEAFLAVELIRTVRTTTESVEFEFQMELFAMSDLFIPRDVILENCVVVLSITLSFAVENRSVEFIVWVRSMFDPLMVDRVVFDWWMVELSTMV